MKTLHLTSNEREIRFEINKDGTTNFTTLHIFGLGNMEYQIKNCSIFKNNFINSIEIKIEKGSLWDKYFAIIEYYDCDQKKSTPEEIKENNEYQLLLELSSI